MKTIITVFIVLLVCGCMFSFKGPALLVSTVVCLFAIPSLLIEILMHYDENGGGTGLSRVGSRRW